MILSLPLPFAYYLWCSWNSLRCGSPLCQASHSSFWWADSLCSKVNQIYWREFPKQNQSPPNMGACQGKAEDCKLDSYRKFAPEDKERLIVVARQWVPRCTEINDSASESYCIISVVMIQIPQVMGECLLIPLNSFWPVGKIHINQYKVYWILACMEGKLF